MGTCVKRALFLISFLLFIVTTGFTKSRTSIEALRIVNSFCQKDQSPMGRGISLKSAVKKLAYTCTDNDTSQTANENAYYYIFNIEKNNGFVIVSGDDRAKDILGYSDSGSFPTENMPENFRNWMAFYEKELKALASIPDTSIVSSTNIPAKINTNAFATSINPLLGTIKWDQSAPYNILCPFIGSKQAPTGCVATAMAQIMKYHQWPLAGAGAKTYKPYEVDDPLTVDFSKATYDWANMANTYDGYSSTAIQDTAVATLMYHCGVAVSMEYSAYSSSAYSNDIPAALSTYFGYDENAQLYVRDYYSEAEWIQMIKKELNSKRPILYGGASIDGSGHQFICDGYDSENLFHFNWGWNGTCNGYFELSSLNVETPGIGGGTGGFSVGQDIITGIRKPIVKSIKSYQIHLLRMLEANNARIARESEFSITYGFANYGGNTFEGSIGLGLYQENTLVSILDEHTDIYLPSYYGDPNMAVDSLSIPPSVSNGIYQIYGIYKAKDQSSWSVMRNKVGIPNSLDVVVNPSDITFTTPNTYPQLTLSEAIKVTGNLYKGKTARLSATIHNAGGEYNSYMVFKLSSPTDPSISQNLTIDPVNIPAGTTKTLELTGHVTLQPGDYILKLMYDFNNDQNNYSLTPMTPGTNNSIHVTVLGTDTIAPALTLTGNISLTNNIIARNSEAVLSAKIKNTGGYFNNSLAAFIFKPTGDTSIDFIGPKNVIFDTDEEKVVTFYKEMNLPAGNYYMALYYLNETSGWTPFSPDSYNMINFTVAYPTGIEEFTAGKPSIYPNPVTDVLYIKSSSIIKSIQILDISGKQISRQEPHTTGTVSVSVNNLNKGVYLIRMETEKEFYTEKFVKK